MHWFYDDLFSGKWAGFGLRKQPKDMEKPSPKNSSVNNEDSEYIGADFVVVVNCGYYNHANLKSRLLSAWS